MSDQNPPPPPPATPPTQGPMSKVLGFAGFAIGMVLMIAFIPVSKDQTVNAIAGAVVGMVGGGLGSFVGSKLDNK